MEQLTLTDAKAQARERNREPVPDPRDADIPSAYPQHLLPGFARESTDRRVRRRRNPHTTRPLTWASEQPAGKCERCERMTLLDLPYCPHSTPHGYTHGARSQMRDNHAGPGEYMPEFADMMPARPTEALALAAIELDADPADYTMPTSWATA